MEATDSQTAAKASPVVSQPVAVVSDAPNPKPTSKPIHTLIIDTGPLIKNDPPVSTLLAQAEELYTLPSVIPEIRDEATRTRVETQLLPFLKLRSPKPESVKFVTDFARRTGDLEVLSRPDLHLIALAYELECERNGGDWRLRKEPNQKRVNGRSPAQLAKDAEAAKEGGVAAADSAAPEEEETSTAVDDAVAVDQSAELPKDETPAPEGPADQSPPVEETLESEAISEKLDALALEPEGDVAPVESTSPEEAVISEQAAEEDANEEEEDDEDGWITPSNLKKHQEKDQKSVPEQPIQKVLQVALLTSDYAMQNVLLRINLNLVSPNFARITQVKTWVLRCHGCFQITRKMDKQFCPRCGQPTLTRVSCSTDQSGNFQVHLKKNFQWNNRGNRYSVPKPVHGTANGKYRGQGGGKNGWGTELLLAEDQKEYVKRVDDDRRTRQRDLMDDDYLPAILSGKRQGGSTRIKVGAGRTVNSRKAN
ncbi:Nin one binding Zn-ribbon like-domain-containing protein [Xylariales sp. PMI_506]|nr:Nin one binding Zn-ribbon like-domain-containing protein [Xylariales sp. PMI_506]